MTWQAEHWFEGLTGDFPAVSWHCSCGDSGTERRSDLAYAGFRAHYAEQQEGEEAA